MSNDASAALQDAATDRVAEDGTEILDAEGVDPWKGPFLEYDKYGEPTGDRFYRCRDCGVEVLKGVDRSNVSHREGCEVSQR